MIAVYREYEGWQSHRAWIEGHNPKLSDNGAMRMKAGAAVGREKVAKADAARNIVRQRMDELLGDGTVLALPAAPGLA
ncbi:MAG: hypothetical protein HKN60_04840, partial [Rhizobiales bacterium]|nr:hypothetical protein [Hyphomicrobiales bacterium]